MDLMMTDSTEMTMDFKKGEGEVLWQTNDYFLACAPENIAGYEVINYATGQVEMVVETEPEAIIGMLYLQDRFDEIMVDPVREYKVRKNKQQAAPGSKLVS
jgi:hypothetical protein